jgi:hypothetical protein
MLKQDPHRICPEAGSGHCLRIFANLEKFLGTGLPGPARSWWNFWNYERSKNHENIAPPTPCTAALARLAGALESPARARIAALAGAETDT